MGYGDKNNSSPLTVAVQAPLQAEFVRLPKAGERDPLFGLSRSFLNTLVLPCRENRYQPPVRSVVLKRARAKTGVRLIEVVSLRQYLLQHVEPAYQPPASSEPAVVAA